MPNGRFNRAYFVVPAGSAPFLSAITFAKDAYQCGHLYCIGSLRSTCSGFDIAYGTWIKPTLFQGLLDHGSLLTGIRCGIAIGSPIMVDRASSNHGINAIAIFKRLIIRFKNDGSYPFSGNKAIATFAKSCTLLSMRNHLAFRKTNIGGGMHVQIYGTSKCHIAFSLLYIFTCLVNCDQCGGTHGVNNGTRALKIQIIGNPID